MSDNIKSMHPVIADFCGLLESKNVPYQLNDNDENMIRFRSLVWRNYCWNLKKL